MKQFTKTLWLVALVLCLGLQQAAAQMQLPPLPVDKNVRIGKLDNGLTTSVTTRNPKTAWSSTSPRR